MALSWTSNNTILSWKSDNIVVINKNNKSYYCKNATLTASHLEWFLQNDAIIFNKDNTIEFNKKLKHAFLTIQETDKPLIPRNHTKGVSEVKHRHDFEVEHRHDFEDIVEDKILTQPVFIDEKKYNVKSDVFYIAHLIHVLKYIINFNDNELTYKKNINVSENMKLFLEKNPYGDIYRYENNMLTINDNVVIEFVKLSDKSYNMVVGYPDIDKITQKYDPKILKRHEETNDILIKKFFNVIIEEDEKKKYNKFKGSEIKNNENLWKLAQIDPHTDMTYLSSINNGEQYEKIRKFLHEETHKYINENKLLNQINLKSKYIFQIFTLIIDSKNELHIAPLVESIYQITEKHSEILQKTNDIIDEQMMKHVYPNITNTNNIIRKTVKFMGFFHIEAEFVNSMSNYYEYHYKTFNSIELNELIYSSSLNNKDGKPFWNSIDLTFNISNDHIYFQKETAEFNGGTINEFNGGAINDFTGYIEFLFKSKYMKVVLFEINAHNHIKTILAYEKPDDIKFYFLEIHNNIANNIDKLINIIEYNNKYPIYHTEKTKYLVVDNIPNLSLFKIVRFELINKTNVELHNLFFKFNPCVKLNIDYALSDIISNKPIKLDGETYINPGNVITEAVKRIVLCMYLKENDKLKLIEHDDEFINLITVNKNYDIDKHKLVETKNYVTINVFENEFKTSQSMCWVINKMTYNELNEIIETAMKIPDLAIKNLTENYLNKLIEIKKYPDEIKFVKTLEDVNPYNYREIIDIMNKTKETLELKNIYCHVYVSYMFNCLHFRMVEKVQEENNFKFSYNTLAEKDNKVSISSINIYLSRLIENLNICPSYYQNFRSSLILYLTPRVIINNYQYENIHS